MPDPDGDLNPTIATVTLEGIRGSGKMELLPGPPHVVERAQTPGPGVSVERHAEGQPSFSGQDL